MPVAVITDSTACIPDEFLKQWGIAVVDVQLQLDDRVDDERRFDRSELIEALRAGRAVSTAPPDPGAFFWAYQEAVSAGADAIVSVHISALLSKTVDSAHEAADQVHVPVHVLDSQTTGMSLGFAALSAARVAAAGGQARRVIEAAEWRCQNSSELIYVDTLEYLRRGGRIGAAAALLGSALSVKPLLTVRHGEVAPLARVPGTRRALAKLIDLAAEQVGGRSVELALVRFGADQRLPDLATQLRERLPDAPEPVVVEASTIIGAHVGPGALGITVSAAS